MLALLMFAIGGYASSKSDVFLTQYNVQSLLFFAVPLAFAAIGQMNALLVGGFDVSVGAVMVLVVVVASGILTSSASVPLLILGSLALLGIGLATGLANAALIRVFGVPSIIATLASLSVLQGIALALRPIPGGSADTDVVAALNRTVGGFLPLGFVGVVVVAVLWDIWLYRSAGGLTTRAVGLDESSSRRVGAPATWIKVRAFVLSGLMAAVGGFFLAAYFSGVGTADPSTVSKFALTSIAACVLGGASLSGGKGSFIGAVLGAVFLSLIINILPLNVLPFHGSASAFELISTGALTLLALVLYQSADLWERLRGAMRDLRAG